LERGANIFSKPHDFSLLSFFHYGLYRTPLFLDKIQEALSEWDCKVICRGDTAVIYFRNYSKASFGKQISLQKSNFEDLVRKTIQSCATDVPLYPAPSDVASFVTLEPGGVSCQVKFHRHVYHCNNNTLLEPKDIFGFPVTSHFNGSYYLGSLMDTSGLFLRHHSGRYVLSPSFVSRFESQKELLLFFNNLSETIWEREYANRPVLWPRDSNPDYPILQVPMKKAWKDYILTWLDPVKKQSLVVWREQKEQQNRYYPDVKSVYSYYNVRDFRSHHWWIKR